MFVGGRLVSARVVRMPAALLGRDLFRSRGALRGSRCFLQIEIHLGRGTELRHHATVRRFDLGINDQGHHIGAARRDSAIGIMSIRVGLDEISSKFRRSEARSSRRRRSRVSRWRL